ncbi:hypothetical protein Vadar_016811 [Vaccinium darrowii]|uniref:Uncharacterized protein n=1 Tax=Vaccinium darrowii TaxID=229202 RepID=A0ACB7YEL0_9ERIC|nr:hypothetical protein Vadar_016811 [Vaccinium darrowii]
MKQSMEKQSMEIEINGSSSPISCEVLDSARDDSRSRRKLEFEDDDDFLNMDVPVEDEGEQNGHNSVHATGDINLVHSKISNEAIPKLDMKFMTEEAAYQFYNAYAYKVGFSVRRSKEHKDKSGRLVDRIFCCSCEGKRGKDNRPGRIIKSHRPETRFGCLARMKIKYCWEAKQYYVVEFVPVHNHVVCTPSKTHLHRSHRNFGVAQAAQADMANDSGIAPSAIVEFMARQAGGRAGLGLIDNRRYEELNADFRANQSTSYLSFPVQILKHAATIYTPDVFLLFQRELSKAHDCCLKQCGENGTITTYEITPFRKHYHHVVTYDSSEEMVSCSCKKFEFGGILCSHALKVLSSNNIVKIPSQYILKRWTKNAKSGSIESTCASTPIEDPKAMMGMRYKELCRLCTQLATRAAETEEAYKIALNALKKIAEEVDASLIGETFQGTPHANIIASQEINEVTYDEGSKKKAKGLKVKKRTTKSSKRPRSALERAIQSKRASVRSNLNYMKNPVQQSEIHPSSRINQEAPMDFAGVTFSALVDSPFERNLLSQSSQLTQQHDTCIFGMGAPPIHQMSSQALQFTQTTKKVPTMTELLQAPLSQQIDHDFWFNSYQCVGQPEE